MEKYTFTQIVNERIREYEEIKRQALALKELIEYDEKYVGTDYRLLFLDEPCMVFNYEYVNKTRRNLHYFTQKYLELIFGIAGEAVKIQKGDEIKKEYSNYFDKKGKTILTIKDIDEFRERINAILYGPIVQELSQYSTTKGIKGSNDISLELYNSFIDFVKDKNRVHFSNYAYDNISKIEGHDTIPNILDYMKESKFNSNQFSDYFREHVEESKDDYNIELDSNYEYKEQNNEDGIFYTSYLQYEVDDTKKKIRLKTYKGE